MALAREPEPPADLDERYRVLVSNAVVEPRDSRLPWRERNQRTLHINPDELVHREVIQRRVTEFRQEME